MLLPHVRQPPCHQAAQEALHPSFALSSRSAGHLGGKGLRRALRQQRQSAFRSPQHAGRQCGCKAKLGTPSFLLKCKMRLLHPFMLSTSSLDAAAGQRDSGAAPDLRDKANQQQSKRPAPVQILLNPSIAKILYKRTLKSLASLPLAIGELFLLAGLSAIGTIIEQNKPLQFYLDAYPDGANKVLGFLTYNWIFALQLDHIYTANYFLGLMALLGVSLAACTSTRQLPMVRVARRSEHTAVCLGMQ